MGNLLLMYIPAFISQYLLIETTQILSQKKCPFWLKAVAAAVIYAFFMLAAYLMQVLPEHTFYWSLGLNISSLGIITAVFQLWKMDSQEKSRFFLSFISAYIFYYFISTCTNVFVLIGYRNLVVWVVQAANLATTLGQLLLYLLVCKKQLGTTYKKIYFNAPLKWLLFLLIAVNFFFIAYLLEFYNQGFAAYLEQIHLAIAGEITWEQASVIMDHVTRDMIFWFMVDLVLTITLIAISSYLVFQQNQMSLKETSLLYQNFYIQKLENIQKEMGTLRHDYKNILAGLYLQAQEGDLEGIQQFVQSTVTKFDDEIGRGIKQTTQLSQLEPSEAKGLMISKMMEMEGKGITCHLEIPDKVSKINMDISDYLRCFGILIDNAIEEAEQQEEPADRQITVAFIQEKDKLVFIVKNPAFQKPNMQKIWEEGYSTKGESRGTGLAGYKNIVKKYANAMMQTLWEEPDFSQILIIS